MQTTRSCHRVKRVLALALALAFLAPAGSVLAQGDGGNVVLKISIEGTVTRGTAIHVEQAIEEAEDRGAPLVITLDTPGGLVSSTLEIKKVVARAEVPVLTYVGPRGAFAESAGTFIFLMGHPNGMAPNTQIGSAQPIVQGAGGGVKNASSKVENFLVGQIREIADRTERNASLAERFITENVNLNESAALETGMSDHTSADLQTFLEDVDGEQALVQGEKITLRTADAQVVELDKGALSKTVELISNPQIAFILFLVGVYGVIFGLAAPGTFVPETIGAILLVLGLIGLGLFDTSTSGLLLLLLGAVFFVAEVFTPTHGILATAGVVAVILGAIFLLDEPLLSRDFLSTFRWVGIISAVVSGGVVLTAVFVAVRVRDRPVETDMVGDIAVVTQPLDPHGKVRVRGEYWNATSTGDRVEQGEKALVVERDGLHLTLEPAEEDERPSGDPRDEGDGQ